MRILYNIFDAENITASQQSQWLAALPREKQARIERLKFRQDQLCSLVGMQLLKLGFSRLGVKDFDLAQLQFPDDGKPYWQAPYDFSISHSANVVAVVVSQDNPVGIDVERFRQVHPRLIEQYFSEHEQHQVEQHYSRFFDFWTIKEAVMKAANRAHLTSLGQIQIGQQHVEFAEQSWLYFPFATTDNFFAHMVCLHTPESLTVQSVSTEDLIANT